MRVYFLTVFVLISLTGAGYYVLANDGVTLGEPVCGNPKYRTFKFKNGNEFTIPEAYLDNRYGLNSGAKNDDGFSDLIITEMNKDDGSPNCNKRLARKDKPYVRITVKPHRFEINKKTTEQWYPFHIEGEEELFELYRPKDTREALEIAGKKDFLVPKHEDFQKTLFIECAISGFSHNRGERIGCSTRSKLKNNVLLVYTYNHKHLSRFQEIDTQLKKVITSFITKSEGE